MWQHLYDAEDVGRQAHFAGQSPNQDKESSDRLRVYQEKDLRTHAHCEVRFGTPVNYLHQSINATTVKANDENVQVSTSIPRWLVGA